eukprot:s1925_g13.t1
MRSMTKRHCAKVDFVSGGRKKVRKNVQNLSTNPVMVNGRQLKQSQTGTILPGGCIAFLARSDGKEEQTTFLEFNLHMDAKRNRPAFETGQRNP